jgi:hypothetical protein
LSSFQDTLKLPQVADPEGAPTEPSTAPAFTVATPVDASDVENTIREKNNLPETSVINQEDVDFEIQQQYDFDAMDPLSKGRAFVFAADRFALEGDFVKAEEARRRATEFFSQVTEELGIVEEEKEQVNNNFFDPEFWTGLHGDLTGIRNENILDLAGMGLNASQSAITLAERRVGTYDDPNRLSLLLNRTSWDASQYREELYMQRMENDAPNYTIRGAIAAVTEVVASFVPWIVAGVATGVTKNPIYLNGLIAASANKKAHDHFDQTGDVSQSVFVGTLEAVITKSVFSMFGKYDKKTQEALSKLFSNPQTLNKFTTLWWSGKTEALAALAWQTGLLGKDVIILREFQYTLNAAYQELIDTKVITESYERSWQNTWDTAVNASVETLLVTAAKSTHPVFRSLVGKSNRRVNFELESLTIHTKKLVDVFTKGSIDNGRGVLLEIETRARESGNPLLIETYEMGKIILDARESTSKSTNLKALLKHRESMEVLLSEGKISDNALNWVKETNSVMTNMFGKANPVLGTESPITKRLESARIAYRAVEEKLSQQTEPVVGLEETINTSEKNFNPRMTATRASKNPAVKKQLEVRQSELLQKQLDKSITGNQLTELHKVTKALEITKLIEPASPEVTDVLIYNVGGVSLTTAQVITVLRKQNKTISPERKAGIIKELGEQFEGMNKREVLIELARLEKAGKENAAEIAKENEESITESHRTIAKEKAESGERKRATAALNDAIDSATKKVLEKSPSTGAFTEQNLVREAWGTFETLIKASRELFKSDVVAKLLGSVKRDPVSGVPIVNTRAQLDLAFEKARTILSKEGVTEIDRSIDNALDARKDRPTLSPIFDSVIVSFKDAFNKARDFDPAALLAYFIKMDAAQGLEVGTSNNRAIQIIEIANKASKKGGTANLTPSEKAELAAFLEHMKSESQAGKDALAAERQVELNESTSVVMNALEATSHGQRAEPGGAGVDTQHMFRRVNYVYKAIKAGFFGREWSLHLSGYAESLYGYKTPAYHIMVTDVLAGKNKAAVAGEQTRASLREALEGSDLDATALYRMSDYFSPSVSSKRVTIGDVGTGQTRLSTSEALDFVLNMMDVETRARLERGDGINIQRLNSLIGVGDKSYAANALRKIEIDYPEIVAMATVISKWMNSPEMRTRIGDILLKETGVNSISPNTYWRREVSQKADASGRNPAEILEVLSTEKPPDSKPGMFKDRKVDVDSSIMIRDGVKKLEEIIDQIAYYEHHYAPLKLATDISLTVRGTERQHVQGSVSHGLVIKQHDFYAKMHREVSTRSQAPSGNAWSRVMVRFKNNLSRAILVGKIAVVLYQPTTVVGAGEHLNTIFGSGGKRAVGTALLIQNARNLTLRTAVEANGEMMTHSGMMITRYWGNKGSAAAAAAGETLGDGSRTVRVAGETFKNYETGIVNRSFEFIGEGIRLADHKAHIAIWTATKKLTERAYKQAGRSAEIGSEAFWAEVTRHFEETSHATQPGWDPSMQAYSQMIAQEHPILGFNAMFRSFTSRNTANQIVYAGRIGKSLKSGDLVGAAKQIKQMFFITVASSAMVPLIREDVKAAVEAGLMTATDALGLTTYWDNQESGFLGKMGEASVLGATQMPLAPFVPLGKAEAEYATAEILSAIGHMTDIEILAAAETFDPSNPVSHNLESIENAFNRLTNISSKSEMEIGDIRSMVAILQGISAGAFGVPQEFTNPILDILTQMEEDKDAAWNKVTEEVITAP